MDRRGKRVHAGGADYPARARGDRQAAGRIDQGRYHRAAGGARRTVFICEAAGGAGFVRALYAARGGGRGRGAGGPGGDERGSHDQRELRRNFGRWENRGVRSEERRRRRGGDSFCGYRHPEGLAGRAAARALWGGVVQSRKDRILLFGIDGGRAARVLSRVRTRGRCGLRKRQDDIRERFRAGQNHRYQHFGRRAVFAADCFLWVRLR